MQGGGAVCGGRGGGRLLPPEVVVPGGCEVGDTAAGDTAEAVEEGGFAHVGGVGVGGGFCCGGVGG